MGLLVRVPAPGVSFQLTVFESATGNFSLSLSLRLGAQYSRSNFCAAARFSPSGFGCPVLRNKIRSATSLDPVCLSYSFLKSCCRILLQESLLSEKLSDWKVEVIWQLSFSNENLLKKL
jgi:hypothetical protein